MNRMMQWQNIKWVANLKIRPRATHLGNSMPEYGLVGVLVVVVCILAMQNLSGGLNAAMAMIKGDMRARHEQAVAAQAMHQAVANGQVNGLSASQQALLEESLSQKLQTTGANGSTEVLANQIAAAANLLLSEGKIDQNQYNILMQLSNQGHKMAQIEALVNQAVIMSNGDYTAFTNMTFTMNGQKYTAVELSGMIGYAALFPHDFTSTSVLNSSAYSAAEPELKTFLDLYNQAASSGALSNSLAQSTVTSAATQIVSIGELVEDTMDQYHLGNVSSPASITNKEVSNSTNMNSAAICTAGSFQDNGVLCTP